MTSPVLADSVRVQDQVLDQALVQVLDPVQVLALAQRITIQTIEQDLWIALARRIVDGKPTRMTAFRQALIQNTSLTTALPSCCTLPPHKAWMFSCR